MADLIIDKTNAVTKVYDLHDRTSFALPYKGKQIIFKGGIYITDDPEYQEAIENWIKQTGKQFAVVENYDENNPKHNPPNARLTQSAHIVNGMVHSGSYNQAQPQVTTGNQIFDALTSGAELAATSEDAQTLADLGFTPNNATIAPAAPKLGASASAAKK